MTNQNSTFGFIDYFVEGTRQRIACQFFRMGKDMMARLDPSGSHPILTAVAAPMRAEVLGDFPAVLERYKTESSVVLAAENFWHECQTDGGCALRFFQVVHHMRLNGSTVSQGLDATIGFSQRLRTSESNAARKVYEMFCAELGRFGIQGLAPDQALTVPGRTPAHSSS